MSVMLTKELYIPISDLQFLCLECPHCHTELRLNMAQKVTNVEETPNPVHVVETPKKCSFCNAAFGVSPKVIDSYRQFFQAMTALTESGEIILGFRIRE